MDLLKCSIESIYSRLTSLMVKKFCVWIKKKLQKCDMCHDASLSQQLVFCKAFASVDFLLNLLIFSF